MDYDRYHFSVGQKYDLTNRRLTFKKYKYISDELFLDLRLRLWRTITWQTSMMIIVFLYFLRMFVHYTVQYAYLSIAQIPITKFEPHWHRIELVYASWMFHQDVLCVMFGIIANTLVFLFLYALSTGIHKKFKAFPKFFYKVIAYYGVYAVLDPLIVFTLDLVSANWANGDYFKFYNYFLRIGSNGLVGAYICFFMVFMLTVCSGYFFYSYMVNRFMNGRVLDLYRRLSGQYKVFFLPMDTELSAKYLQWVVNRAKKNNCVLVSSQEQVRDKYGNPQTVSFLKIHKVDQGGLRRNRLFFKDYDGALREVQQRRDWLSDKEIRHLTKQHEKGCTAVYGNWEATLEQMIDMTIEKRKAEEMGAVAEVASQAADGVPGVPGLVYNSLSPTS